MIKEDGSKATLEEFFEAFEKHKITPNQLRKLKSNDDIDKLVKDNVNFVNGLSERFRKDVENNVRAWRKTVDG